MISLTPGPLYMPFPLRNVFPAAFLLYLANALLSLKPVCTQPGPAFLALCLPSPSQFVIIHSFMCYLTSTSVHPLQGEPRSTGMVDVFVEH